MKDLFLVSVEIAVGCRYIFALSIGLLLRRQPDFAVETFLLLFFENQVNDARAGVRVEFCRGLLMISMRSMAEAGRLSRPVWLP